MTLNTNNMNGYQAAWIEVLRQLAIKLNIQKG